MSDKSKDDKPSTRVDEEPPAPKPVVDEDTYTAAAATDPRVTHPAETEEQAAKREADAKKPAPAAQPARDDKSKHS